jgi:hypothetical protein
VNEKTNMRLGAQGITALANGRRFISRFIVLTDLPPRTSSLRAKYDESDRLATLELPPGNRLRELAQNIESVMQNGKRLAIQQACAEFMAVASEFYGVPQPQIQALAARPIRVREGGWGTELFGDYQPATGAIRIWTRTAVRKQVTSSGTFLSTLCHEFCHHLDCQRFGFQRSPHTRGFYARTAILYHHARGTPPKPLLWARMPRDRWRIDWRRMRALHSTQTS